MSEFVIETFLKRYGMREDVEVRVSLAPKCVGCAGQTLTRLLFLRGGGRS